MTDRRRPAGEVRSQRHSEVSPIEEVAAVIERLAVLLAAGVAPASAWGYLATNAERGNESGAGAAQVRRSLDSVRRPRELPSTINGSSVVRAVAARGSFGSAIADSIAEAAPNGDHAGALARMRVGSRVDAELSDAWRGLAAAWRVATESGSPLSPCLRSLAASFRALGETQRDLQIAFAGPAATAKMVMALPVVGVLFGITLGFDTVHVLFATVPGLVCMTAGASLMVAGSLWNRAMIMGARPKNIVPGLLVDLMVIGMSGGGSLVSAKQLVGDVAARYGVGEPSSDSVESTIINEVLDLAQRAGVPAAELLRSEAEQLRRQARFDGRQRAAALSVRLMFPLGLCVLPAFMLLGVAPLLMAVLSSTVANF